MGNFVVAHLQKFNLSDLTGMEKHLDHSGKESKNKDIDKSRTYLNYDVKDVRAQSCNLRNKVRDKVNNRSNNSTKLRKDAVAFCSVVVSASPDFFVGKSPEFVQTYFETASDYLDKQFGNCVCAVVHMDEQTPHMHYVFVPLTQDNELCAKKIVTRYSLTQLQENLPKYLQERGYDVQRGVKDSPRYHIDTTQWKKDELIMEATKEKLISKLNFEPTTVLGKQILSKEHFSSLKNVAVQTVHMIQNKSEANREAYERRKRLENEEKEKIAELQRLQEEQKSQQADIIAKQRSLQQQAEDILTKKAILDGREENLKAEERRQAELTAELERYKQVLELQDKDLELQKLLEDAAADRQAAEMLKKEHERRLLELQSAEDAATERVRAAAKAAVMKEVAAQGSQDYWDAAAMRKLAAENPEMYEKLINAAKAQSLEESQKQAFLELKEKKAHSKDIRK